MSWIAGPSWASELGDLAASMSPGEWRELSTSGLSAAIDDNGSSQHILTFSQGGRTWNPATNEAYFIGGDHNGGNEHFIRYVAATNEWQSMPDPPWFPQGSTQNHSYNYNTIDTANQYFYNKTRRYDIETGNWDSVADLPQALRANRAFEYFEGLGLVAFNNGEVYLLPDGATSWTDVASNLSWTGLHALGEYSQPLGAMILGGGDNSDSLYKLEADLSITSLPGTPLSELSTNSTSGILTHDPVSGDFLFVDGDHSFWKYDLQTWTSLPSLDFITNSYVDDCIFIPVSTYGVVILIEWIAPGNSKMWVYKHGEGGARSNPPGELIAN